MKLASGNRAGKRVMSEETVVIVFALWAVAGLHFCTFGFSAGKAVVKNECTSDSDCDEGSRCDMATGVCMKGTTSGRDFILKVLCREGDEHNYLPQYFEVEGGVESVELNLLRSVDIEGIVNWDFDPVGDGNVRARVEVVPDGPFPQSLMPSDAVETGQLYSLPLKGGEDKMVSFSIPVLPGVYSIRIVPVDPYDELLPPWKVVDSEEVLQEKVITVNYPAVEKLRVISGRVKKTDGSIAADVLVWAENSFTGERISSYFTTDYDTGYFRLYLLPPSYYPGGVDEADSFFIVVSSPEENPTYPTIRFGPYNFELLDVDLDGRKDGRVDFESDVDESLRIVFPPDSLTKIEYQASVEGQWDVGQRVVVEGVSVKFRTDSIDGENYSGYYEVYATTDADGRIVDSNGSWGVWLIPGDYSVYLYPPLNGEFQAVKITSVRVSVEGGSPQSGRVFVLERKKMIGGLIVKQVDGKGMGFTSVEAYPAELSASEADGQVVLARFNSAKCDEEGRFFISLDEGIYNVVAMPLAESNYPWVWISSIHVPFEQNGGTDLIIDIPDPSLLKGKVVGATGEGISGATVKVFELPDTVSRQEAERQSLIQIGEGITSSDGTFVIPVAPM